MEQMEPFWFPVGTSDLVSEYSGPQVQQATAASAPFLMSAHPCTEQAQMDASLELPLKSVLSKSAGLKRVGNRLG